MSKRRAHALSRQDAKQTGEREREKKLTPVLKREREGVVVAPP